jgi:Rrf2 family protein
VQDDGAAPARRSAACTSSNTRAAAVFETQQESLMRLSAKAQYACVAMLSLAANYGDPNSLRVKVLADKHGISQRFLVQILLQLKAVGLVDSTRGTMGGYLLARPPAQISLADIVHAIDQQPPAEPLALSGLYSTPIVRVVSDALREAHEREQSRLAEVTLEDLVKLSNQRSELAYQI